MQIHFDSLFSKILGRYYSNISINMHINSVEAAYYKVLQKTKELYESINN